MSTPEGIAEDTKVCRKCGTRDELDEFPPNPRVSDGRSSWCRRCHNDATAAWREANRDKVNYNTPERRVKHEPRPCVECGEQFVPRRSDALVCSKRCQWARSRRQRKAR